MIAFWAFVKKEYYHIIRDMRSLMILIGMPIVQIILFGFAITNEITEAKIAIYDESKDAMTQAISQKILSTKYFKLADNISSPNEMEDAFRKGKIKLGLVFGPDFQKQINQNIPVNIQVLSDATDPNTATTLYNYINVIIADYQSDLKKGQPSINLIKTESMMLYNPQLKGVYFFVPGLITIILMLISAMMSSISITKEKEKGSMEVLLVSPLKPGMIIIGKVVPYIFLSMINGIAILILGYYVFGVPVNGSLFLLMVEIILFIITSLSLGILISTKVETQQVALLISLMALMLPTIILSGFIFPVESMPKILQYISHVIPAKWFIIIIKNVMLKGVGIAIVWKETLILLGMTVFFIVASIKNFKTRLE